MPRRTVFWREGRRLAGATPIVYVSGRVASRMNLVSEIRSRFDRAATLELTGLPRLAAVARVGLPAGTWDLFGGRRQSHEIVFWQRRGLDRRGYQHHTSCKHMTRDGKITLCGHQIPSCESHEVHRANPGEETCISCLASARCTTR